MANSKVSNKFLYSSTRLRDGVIVNLVWKFIAQFSRRYASEYYFSFEQIHPGSSLGGMLEVHVHLKDENARPRESVGMLQFHIGGPNRGCLKIGNASKPIEHRVEENENNFVEALLSSNFENFYEYAAAMLELPHWHKPLPMANRFAISMQFISMVQNSLTIYPHEFRPACGSCQHGLSLTGEVADFHRKWAYEYFDEKLLPGLDFVGRTDEEVSSLLTI